ncbi:hypothetical protein AO379_1505 [Moraxella catarrhalis]|nr:hypothetical protein AO379_1505 [Moraxella catarrhalis]
MNALLFAGIYWEIGQNQPNLLADRLINQLIPATNQMSS